jgi:hypothetical protein
MRGAATLLCFLFMLDTLPEIGEWENGEEQEVSLAGGTMLHRGHQPPPTEDERGAWSADRPLHARVVELG